MFSYILEIFNKIKVNFVTLKNKKCERLIFKDFNQNIENLDLINVNQLTFNNNFNHTECIDLINVNQLTFNNNFNQPIENVDLTNLEFGEEFNQLI